MGRPIWGELGSGRVGMDKAAQRQLHHIGHIGIGDMATAALCEHGGNPLQIQIALFHRQHTRHVHHGRKLIVSQTKHVPDDNPEKGKLDQWQ